MGKVTKSYQQVKKHSHSDTPKPCQNRVFGRLYRVIFKYRILRKISSSDFFKFPQSYHSYICTKSLSDISTGKAYLFSALFSHEKRSNRFI